MNQNPVKKFWNFLKEDSWQSTLVSLVLLIILIKFVLFPILTLATSSPLPLVVVESCSMYHNSNFDDWWFRYSAQYEEFNITKEEFKEFSMKSGLNKGDIIFVWGRSEVKKGDIIIFYPNKGSLAPNPIIHRVVTDSPIGTKGDNGETNPYQLDGRNPQNLDERKILEEQILGEAKIKVPLVGWIKLIFFEFSRSPEQRGFC